MKYKLINKTTGEEHFCFKFSDGHDYYVKFVKEQVVLNKVYYEHDNHNPIYSFTKDMLPNSYYLQEVIGTNNPLMDLPKIVDDVEELANKLIPKLQHNKYVKTGFITGYNIAKEKFKWTDNDMIDFYNWLNQYQDLSCALRINEVNTISELLNIFKPEVIKTIYF